MKTKTKRISQSRIDAAKKICKPDKLDGIHKSPAGMTIDMMLCEMQRIYEILDGRPYYDYEAQQWKEGNR